MDGENQTRDARRPQDATLRQLRRTLLAPELLRDVGQSESWRKMAAGSLWIASAAT
jgi:hypothetical protein